MKILFFGRGVIATQYAWVLEKAGNTVEFYVRPGRAAEFGPEVRLDLTDARAGKTRVQERWPVVLREEIPVPHDYDLIVVSITHDRVPEAVGFLAPRVGRATVLMFNNLWKEPAEAVAALPPGQVVWGFPGGGGAFHQDGTLRGGFLKSVFFGRLRSEREVEVGRLFREAGFSIRQNDDFRGWLWHHFVLDAAIGAQALHVGDYLKTLDSPAELKAAVLVMRELLGVLEARGLKLSLAAQFPRFLPAGAVAWILREAALAPGQFARSLVEAIVSSGTWERELRLFASDVLAEARRLGVAVPRLEALSGAFLGPREA